MPDGLVLDGSTILRSAEGVLSRSAGDETVLLNLDSEEFYGLDGVGARVFELLEQPRRLDDVIGRLHSEFDVDLETLIEDVTALVSELVAHKLLVVVA